MDLDHSHDPEAVAKRLAGNRRASYVGDAVLGAIDGSVTTVAIVAGTIGAQLHETAIIILGLANLFADGFSMAVGNYQRARSDQAFASQVERIEQRHITESPAGEREEVRQLFAAKGFESPLLEQAVDVITSDRQRWVDMMVREEWGIAEAQQNPVKVAFVTFWAFVLVGLVPLLPFTLPLATDTSMQLTALLTSLAFLGIGIWRARIFGERLVYGAVGTLATGGTAAVVAYAVAYYLHGLLQ